MATKPDPNWVKGTLFIQCAKEGIENFIERGIDQLHQDILNRLPAGASCSSCTTENIVPCGYNNNFCQFSYRTCCVHDMNDPNKKPRHCPNLFCDNVRAEIMKHHRFFSPSWSNIDCTRWAREPWELAKCFMSQGFATVTSAADTDLSGLLCVIINCKVFDNLVTDNLSSKPNIFCEVRRIRNTILHNHAMTLTDAELQDYINPIKQMLSDSKTLASSPDAMEAIIKIDEILNEEEKEDGLQHIGENLAYFSMKTLGHGSSAVVFEGRFGRFDPKPVAVKMIKCSNEKDAKETQTDINKIYREIQNMETLNKSKSPNVIEFIDSVIDKNIVYIAFELAKGTLHDYVDNSNVAWQRALPGTTVTREIVNGLDFTHHKKIVHRDLKPANIFIVENSGTGLKAVIGDYGTAKTTAASMFSLTGRMGSMGYIAPEIWRAMEDAAESSFGSRCSKQADIFSLGLVIYFALSLGKHPYGNAMTAQIEIVKASVPNLDQIHSHINSYAFIHMLSPMLNDNPAERPRIEKIREHPALMSADKVMEYFVNKSDEFENQIKADPVMANLLEDPSLVTNMNWMNHLPVHMQNYLRIYKLKNRSNPLYQGKETSIRYLLRAVRNTKAHHTDYPQIVQTEIGDFPDGHVALWLKVCPKLLMHIHDKLGPP